MRRRGLVTAAVLIAGSCSVYWAGSDDPPASTAEPEQRSWIVDIILNIADTPSGPKPRVPPGHLTPAQCEAMELDAGHAVVSAWAQALAPLMAQNAGQTLEGRADAAFAARDGRQPGARPGRDVSSRR